MTVRMTGLEGRSPVMDGFPSMFEIEVDAQYHHQYHNNQKGFS